MQRQNLRQNLINNQEIDQQQNRSHAYNTQHVGHSSHHKNNNNCMHNNGQVQEEQKQHQNRKDSTYPKPNKTRNQSCKQQEAQQIQMQNMHAPNNSNNTQNRVQVDRKWLRQLFKVNNVLNGQSVSMIRAAGNIQGLMHQLNTNQQDGIPGDEQDLLHRQNSYGTNNPLILQQTSFAFYFMDYITSNLSLFVMFMVFLVVQVICLLMHVAPVSQIFLELLVVVIVYLAVACTNVYFRYRQSTFNKHRNRILFDGQVSQYLKLIRRIQKFEVCVRRNGIKVNKHITEIVVGDIVQVKEGDYIPAYGVVLQSNNFATRDILEQAILSKYAIEIDNQQQNQQVQERIRVNFHKCLVDSLSVTERGTAVILILAVDFQLFLSQYYRQLLQYLSKQKTTYRKEITQFQTHIKSTQNLHLTAIYHILFMAILVGCVIYLISGRQADWVFVCAARFMPVLYVLVLLKQLFVVYIATVFYQQAYIQKLMDTNILINSHEVIQHLGKLQQFCLTNLGLLITKDWKVKSLSVSNNIILNLNDIEQNILQFKRITNKNYQDLFVQLLVITDTCIPTNNYCQKFAIKMGYDYAQIKDKYNDILYTIQSRSKKYTKNDRFFHAIVFKGLIYYLQDHTTKYTTSKHIVAVQAQFQQIFDLCDKYIDLHGQIQHMDENYKSTMLANVEQFQLHQSLTTRILCFKQISNIFSVYSAEYKDIFVESGFVLVGLVNLHCQLKRSASMVVNQISNSGIGLRLLSGSNLHTCVSISKEANILPDNFQLTENSQVAMSAKKLISKLQQIGFSEKNKYECNRLQLKQIMQKVKVVSRCLLTQRQIIINAIKQTDRIFATFGLSDKNPENLPHVNINIAYGEKKQRGNVLIKNFDFNKIIYLIAVGRNLYLYIAKIYKFNRTAEVTAIILIFLYSILVNQNNFYFAFNVFISYLILNVGAILVLIQMPIFSSILRRDGQNIPILNRRAMRGFDMVISTQIIIFVFMIVLFQDIARFLKLQYQSNSDASQKAQILGQVLNKTFIFLQLFNLVNTLKNNNFFTYAAAIFNQSFPFFLMNNLKVIFRIIMFYMCYQILVKSLRILGLGNLSILDNMLGLIGGKWYTLCFFQGGLILVADQIANIAHFIEFQLNMYE